MLQGLEMLTVEFGESTLSQKSVFRWYKRFREGRCWDDEPPGGTTTSRSEQNIETVKKIVLANRRIPIRKVAEDIDISIGSCHSIASNVLGMELVSAKSVGTSVLYQRGLFCTEQSRYCWINKFTYSLENTSYALNSGISLKFVH